MSRSDRNLRNLDRVDYREPREESIDELFNESSNNATPVQNTPDSVDPVVSAETSLAVSVNDSEHFQHTVVAEASTHSTSTPVRPFRVLPQLPLDRSPVVCDKLVPPASPTEALPSAEDSYATAVTSQSSESVVDRLELFGTLLEERVELEEPAEVAAPPVEVEPVVGEELAEVHVTIEEVEMAAPELRKTVAALQTNMFQISEIVESMDDLKLLSKNEVMKMHDELKQLRVELVNLNSEINLVEDPNHNYDDDVKKLLSETKDNLRDLKLYLSNLENVDEQMKADRDAAAKDERIRLRDEKAAEEKAKVEAFKRAVQDIKAMKSSLENMYTTVNLSKERNDILRRDKDKGLIAAEFTRMRDAIDKLMTQTDVIPGKESALQEIRSFAPAIEKWKKVYEDKIHKDLIEHDLTEDKLKIAESAAVDIGKFNGELGVGDDYYTFRSKFEKTYINYPKSLKIEKLKNNHLEGPAKDAVGSLEALDEIWERLKKNFGNTELMMNYKFSTIGKLGVMSRRKTYRDKKVYVQTLINTMQEVFDLAVEHGLTGELHYGQQLTKVVSVLENYYQNQWYKLLADENVGKPARWERMIRFLNDQLTVLQLRALECESTESSSRDKEHNNNDTKNKQRTK